MAYGVTKNGIDWSRIKSVDMLRALSGSLASMLVVDLAAKAVGVHAALAGNAAVTFPGPFTSPAELPRTIQAVFASSYDGGNITITGKDQFGRTVSDTITASPGSTVDGVVAFSSVTGAVRSTVGATANTVTLQTGGKLALPWPMKNAWGIQLHDGIAEACTFNATYHTFLPTTAPNGTVDFLVIWPVDAEAARTLASVF